MVIASILALILATASVSSPDYGVPLPSPDAIPIWNAQAPQETLSVYVPPKYPLKAQHFGVTGTVSIIATYSTSGRVTEIQIVKSSGDEELDQAAARAVKKWRVKPLQRDGKPAAGRLFVPIEFRLP